MSKFSFLYWSAWCFAAGWYFAKTDAGEDLKRLTVQAYDGIIDYTVARAEAQRRRGDDPPQLAKAM